MINKIKKWLIGDRKFFAALFHWKMQVVIFATLILILIIIMAIK